MGFVIAHYKGVSGAFCVSGDSAGVAGDGEECEQAESSIRRAAEIPRIKVNDVI